MGAWWSGNETQRQRQTATNCWLRKCKQTAASLSTAGLVRHIGLEPCLEHENIP
jgi:hypothetical protein